jgi:hypothetical protein
MCSTVFLTRNVGSFLSTRLLHNNVARVMN